MPVLAIPALGAIVIAAMAILILLSGKYLAKFIAHIIPSGIPGFGHVANAIEGAFDSALDAVGNVMDAAVGPLAKLVSYPFRAMGHLYDEIIAFASDTVAFGKWVAKTAIPAAIHTAETWAAQKIAAAEARLTAAVTAARRYALDLVNAARAYALALVHQLEAKLTAAIIAAAHVAHVEALAVRAFATAGLASLRGYIDALVARTVATLTASILAVDHYAHTAYAALSAALARGISEAEDFAAAAATAAEHAAIDAVETAVTLGIGDVWGDVVAGVDGAIDAAGDGFDWVRDELAKIDLSKVADVAGLAAITGISVGVLTRYLKECGMPNCRNLGKFGRDLSALLGIVEGVAFVELIAEMVRDPHGAARDVADTLGSLGESTAHGVRDLIGV